MIFSAPWHPCVSRNSTLPISESSFCDEAETYKHASFFTLCISHFTLDKEHRLQTSSFQCVHRLRHMTSYFRNMIQKLREQKLILVALLLVLIDQATKLWVKGFTLGSWVHEGVPLYSSKQVVGDLVRWTYVENPGMAFGITFGDGKIFLSLFSVVAAIALTWYLTKLRTAPMVLQIGVMLLLAGATGNLIDRVFYGVLYNEAPLFYGKVVDFIDVDCPDFRLFNRDITRWYIFNIADACVSCGIVLLILFNHKLPHLPAERHGEPVLHPSGQPLNIDAASGTPVENESASPSQQDEAKNEQNTSQKQA